MRNMSQRGWAPMPRLSGPGERERNAVVAIRVGVNMLQFCSASNSLSHTTLSLSEKYIFLKEVSSLVFIASLCFCMHMYYVAIVHDYSVTTHTHTHTHTHIYMHVYMHVYIYIYIYIYIMRWVHSRLNYAKITITLTSHFIRYYDNMRYSLVI